MTGLELKIMRVRAGLRQYEIAEKVGIAATRLCEYESGRRKLSDAMAERIAQAIERSVRAKDLLATIERDIQ